MNPGHYYATRNVSLVRSLVRVRVSTLFGLVVIPEGTDDAYPLDYWSEFEPCGPLEPLVCEFCGQANSVYQPGDACSDCRRTRETG